VGWLRKREWSWWQAGIALGLLNMFAFLMQVGSFGKLTFPELLGVNAWMVIVPVVLACVGFLVWVDRKGSRSATPRDFPGSASPGVARSSRARRSSWSST
jgi:hypothetical protein